MHATHILNLRGILGNVEMAIDRGELVTIAGGHFDIDEILSLKLAIEYVLYLEAFAEDP